MGKGLFEITGDTYYHGFKKGQVVEILSVDDEGDYECRGPVSGSGVLTQYVPPTDGKIIIGNVQKGGKE